MDVWNNVQSEIGYINGQQFKIIFNKKNKIDISKTLKQNNIKPYRGLLMFSSKSKLQNAIYYGVRKSLKGIKKQKTDSLVAVNFIKDTISSALGALQSAKQVTKDEYANMKKTLKEHRLKIKQGPQWGDALDL